MGTSQNADAEGATVESGPVRSVFSVCFCHPSAKRVNYILFQSILQKFTSYTRNLGDSGGKEPICQCRRLKRCEFSGWGRIPWKRAWQPTPVFLPGGSHGQRILVGYSPGRHKESDTTEWLTHNRNTFKKKPFVMHIATFSVSPSHRGLLCCISFILVFPWSRTLNE